MLSRLGGDVADRLRRGEPVTDAELSAAFSNVLEPTLVDLATGEAVRQGAIVGVAFDEAVLNAEAITWARGYGYDLVSGLTETTQGVVSEATQSFFTTPGMTKGELEALLEPAFGARRAEMIATTEVTRAFSAGQEQYQRALAAEGIDMERVWVTQGDEIAANCPLCGPLNGKPEDEWDAGPPPRHVRCRCSTVLRLREQRGAGEEAMAALPGPLGDKISGAFSELPTRGKAADVARTALDAIDRVHGVGTVSMPRIPITTFSGGKNLAQYRYGGGRAVGLQFKPNASHANMNIVHEVGHFLDHQAIRRGLGETGTWATSFSIREPGMAEWWAATQNSSRIKAYQARMADTARVIDVLLPTGETITYQVPKAYLRNLLRPEEVFARSYAQYIAQRSGDAVLQAELRAALAEGRGVIDYCMQWDVDDFEPIAKAFDNLFRKLGWMA